jgi:oxygen-independent coproporphyrinogen-3 oxidase
VNQLIEEIRMQSKFYPDYQITTIFIGGGTPSILPAQWIANIMSASTKALRSRHRRRSRSNAIPARLRDKLAFYKEAGINRISLGLQSRTIRN